MRVSTFGRREESKFSVMVLTRKEELIAYCSTDRPTQPLIRTSPRQDVVMNSREKGSLQRKKGIRGSFWVIVGFVLWVGFFIGAVIMHAMNK